MTFETWVLALATLAALAFALHALATGRVGGDRRSSAPARYWASVVAMLLFAGLGAYFWHRSLRHGLDPGFLPAALSGTSLLCLLVAVLISGEIVLLSRTPLRRRERPGAYWTLTALLALLAAICAAAVADSLA